MYEIPVYRVALVKEASASLRVEKMTSPDAVALVLARYFKGVDREHFAVVMLNEKNIIIGINTVSIGTLNQSLCHPREVFKPAILCNAAGVILSHNHPSGDPQPSTEDRIMTARMKEAGELLGIKVLDHIIMGEGTDHFSFRTETEAKKREEEDKRRLINLERAQARLLKGKATTSDVLCTARFVIINALDSEKDVSIGAVRGTVNELARIAESKKTKLIFRQQAKNLLRAGKVLIEALTERECRKNLKAQE